MKTRQQQETGRALRKAVLEEQRRLRAQALDEIRSRIERIKLRRKELSGRVRAQCQRARARARDRIRERREEVMASLRREVQEIRQAERNRCQLRRARVNLESEGARARARRELDERRRAEQVERRIDRHTAKHERRHRKAERQQESDDEVRSNIDAELVPIFDRVRSRIRAKPGQSRTEVFTHWLEENPSEVWAMREELAERKLQALIREEARAAKDLRKCGGRCKRKRASGTELEAVPF